MDVIGKIIERLDTQMQTPPSYGIFHIVSIILTAVFTVFLILTHKHGKEEMARRVIFIVSLAVIFLEIYKQINYTFSYDGKIKADYQWYAFPWQFCSTPMYIGLIAGLIKKCKIRDALISYLATYALFAGLCVMVYPGDVFCGTVGINIQTMVCHGSMVSIGIYLLATKTVRLEHKTILSAMCVFAAVMGIAMLMNEAAFLAGITEAENFNMFYISPHEEPHLPVYSTVQELIPYPFCTIVYFAAFSIAAYIMLLAAMGTKKLIYSKK